MARVNKCKVCGWDGLPPEIDEESKCWVGTNHNLCSICAAKRQEETRRTQHDARRHEGEQKSTLPLALAAIGLAGMIGPGKI